MAKRLQRQESQGREVDEEDEVCFQIGRVGVWMHDRLEAWENDRLEAWENDRLEGWENRSVEVW